MIKPLDVDLLIIQLYYRKHFQNLLSIFVKELRQLLTKFLFIKMLFYIQINIMIMKTLKLL